MQEPSAHLRWRTMVDRLVQEYPFKNPLIEAAFRQVPRHIFLPDVPLEQVYDYTQAIPIRRGADGRPTSSSSAPDIMGLMLDMLDIQAGQRVLEIGAGTGYNAAILAAMVGPQGRVVSIDIQPDLVENARARLAEIGFPWVQFEAGDGGYGFAAGAPYDRIIVTARASSIAPAWREQLAQGGRLVLPFELFGIQNAIAFEHSGDELVTRAHTGCGFMPLQGAFARAFPTQIPLGPQVGVFMDGFHDRDYGPPAETLWQWLAHASQAQPSGVSVTWDEFSNRLTPWLLLRWDQDGATLWATGEAATPPPFPGVMGFGGSWKAITTLAFFEPDSAALLARPPGQEVQPVDPTHSSVTNPFELYVLPLGPSLHTSQALLDLLRTWNQLGRPAVDWMSLRVLPLESTVSPSPDETIIPSPWARLFVRLYS